MSGAREISGDDNKSGGDPDRREPHPLRHGKREMNGMRDNVAIRKALIPPDRQAGYRKPLSEVVSVPVFKPEHMARGMKALYPALAREIVIGLMRDAIAIGEDARAWLWWEVLVRIGRIEQEERVRLH
jgi:hypothetical protein